MAHRQLISLLRHHVYCHFFPTVFLAPSDLWTPIVSPNALCRWTRQQWYDDTCEYTEKYKSKKISTTSEKKRRNKNQRTWLLRLNFHPIYTSNEKNRRPYKGEWYYINITIIWYWCAICGQHSVGGHLIMIVITAYIHASWDSVLFIYRLAPKLGLEMIERISAVVTSS